MENTFQMDVVSKFIYFTFNFSSLKYDTRLPMKFLVLTLVYLPQLLSLVKLYVTKYMYNVIIKFIRMPFKAVMCTWLTEHIYTIMIVCANIFFAEIPTYTRLMQYNHEICKMWIVQSCVTMTM